MAATTGIPASRVPRAPDLHELSPQDPSLEEAFMALTHDAVEYTATATRPPAGAGRAA